MQQTLRTHKDTSSAGAESPSLQPAYVPTTHDKGRAIWTSSTMLSQVERGPSFTDQARVEVFGSLILVGAGPLYDKARMVLLEWLEGVGDLIPIGSGMCFLLRGAGISSCRPTDSGRKRMHGIFLVFLGRRTPLHSAQVRSRGWRRPSPGSDILVLWRVGYPI